MQATPASCKCKCDSNNMVRSTFQMLHFNQLLGVLIYSALFIYSWAQEV